MTMTQNAQPALRRALLLALVASLLSATLVVGSLASWWLGRYDRDHALQRHQLQLALAAGGLAGELRALSQAVAQLARDGDVLFAPSAALFASPAVDKLERLLAGQAPGIRGYLADAKGQLIDAVAPELTPQLPMAVARLIPQLLERQSNPTSALPLALQFEQRPALALVQPLILQALADAPVSPGVGALVLLIDSDWLLARSRAQLGDYQLLALSIGEQRLQLRADVGGDDLQLSHSLILADDLALTLVVTLDDEQFSQLLGAGRLQLWLLLLFAVLLLLPLVLWLGLRPLRDLQQFVSFTASYHDGHFHLPRPPLRWHEQQQLWAVLQQLQQPVEGSGGAVVQLSPRQRSSGQLGVAAADNADKVR